MKFGTRSSPRVKVVVGCLRSELVDEMMSSVAKTPIRGESDRFEVDVELLVGDDFGWFLMQMLSSFRFTLFFNLAFALLSMLSRFHTHVPWVCIAPRLLLRAPSSCTRRAAHRTVRIENEMRTIRSAKVFDCFIFDHDPQICIRKGDSSQGLDGPVILIECGVLLMHKPIQRTRKPVSSQLFRVLLAPASEWEASAANVSAISITVFHNVYRFDDRRVRHVSKIM